MPKSTTSRQGSRRKREPRGSRYRRIAGAREAQERRRKGSSVNPLMDYPSSFCEAVTPEKCVICGEYASWVNFGIDSQDAVIKIRQQFPGGWAPEGQLYITRGPILWAMHVLKTEQFFMRHMGHCELQMEYAPQIALPPFPPPVVWAESFGTSKEKRIAAQFYKEIGELQDQLLPGDFVMPGNYTKSMNRLLDILINLRKKDQRETIKTDLFAWKEEIITLESEPQGFDEGDLPF
jgi:hypothetical protein